MYFNIPNRTETNFTVTLPSLNAVSLLPSVRCSRNPFQISPHYMNFSHCSLSANSYILLFSSRSENLKFSFLFCDWLLMTWYLSPVLWHLWNPCEDTTGFSQSVRANSMHSPPGKIYDVQTCQSLNFPFIPNEWN